jgi:hypothetical protein
MTELPPGVCGRGDVNDRTSVGVCVCFEPRFRSEPMSDLLEQFLTQECTAHVRSLLEGAISDSVTPRPHFEFNRFEITIDRVANIVVLQDVLDATAAGVRQFRSRSSSLPSGAALITASPGMP